MRRSWTIFAALVAISALASCGGIDKILEGNPLIIKLTFTSDSGALTIPQGSAKSQRLRVTPVGDVLKGAIAISVDKVPTGMTVTIDSIETEGITTSARVTIEVSAATPLGPQEIRLAAKAAHANDGGTLLRVAVVPPAVIALSLARPTLTIARGGGAPITAQLVRTSFPLAVKFALAGAPAGFTTTFDAAGTTANTATASIVVASTVTPGTYTMNLRASGTGVADQLVPLTVDVTADMIQLISDVGIATPQAVSAFTDFVINRGAGVGAVTLTAENVPAGVAATFDKTTTTDATGRITLVPLGTVVAGDYTATIRAQSAGFPDATATVQLTVLDASITVAVNPGTFEVLQAQSTLTNVALTRTRFTGAVNLTVTGLPTGLTATAQPSSTSGVSATVNFQATASAAAGTYDINVNATPVGLGASKVRTAVAKVTIRAVPAGANVVLDWTGCTMPLWIASQNGQGGVWNRVIPVGSQAGFLVNTGRGGYAWADGTGLNVRFALQNELTAKPIPMCPPPDNTGSKSITGIAAHTNAGEQWSYSLGGGTATSTTASPAFTIFGVTNGTHDLVAMGQTIGGTRGLVRRDLNLPNGSALDPIDLTNTEGFGVVPRNMIIAIGLLAGEGLTYNYNYLTTAACVENRLAAGASSTTQSYNGIPDNVQRPDDYHEFFAAGSSIAGTRTMSVTFHSAANRTMVMPTNPTNSAVAPVAPANQNITQLRATIGAIPGNYNAAVTLSYRYNSQTMSVSATPGYTTFANVFLTMPDFTGVSGYQSSYAIPPGVGGTWRLALEGASVVGPRCTEGRSAVQFVRSGAY